MSDLKRFMSSSRARTTIYAVSALILALLIFHAGVVAGSHRHFHDFGGRGWDFRGHGFDVRLPHGFIPNDHGAVGTVESVTSSSLTLQTRDGTTEKILLASTTIIRDQSGNANLTALVAGAHVVVLGTPSADGTLFANLIRIGPKSLAATSTQK